MRLRVTALTILLAALLLGCTGKYSSPTAAAAPTTVPSASVLQPPANVLAYLRAEQTYDKDHVCQYMAPTTPADCAHIQADMAAAQSMGVKTLGGKIIGVVPTQDGGTITAYYALSEAGNPPQKIDAGFLIYADPDGKVWKVE